MSEQHFGRHAQSELRLRSSDVAAYASGEALPEGAELFLLWTPQPSTPSSSLVESPSATSPTAKAPWVLAMQKVEGRWRYRLERAEGAAESAHELARCARCHAEAPHDQLFRVPLGHAQ